MFYKEYKYRLRLHNNRQDFTEINKGKYQNIKIKLFLTLINKSVPFTMSELDLGLKTMNRGKSMDPFGSFSEIFTLITSGQI